MKTRKIVVANWKMNPTSAKEAKMLFSQIKRKASILKKTSVVVAPPFAFLSLFSSTKKALKNFSLGAQNTSWQSSGALTGEVSSPMLKDLGVSYVIVGHSERRVLGETDALVARKVASLLGERLLPILCIGEAERDQHGEYLSVLSNQIKSSLLGVSKRDIVNIVIAYEPVWAIGKTAKDAMDSHKLHETTLFIRKTLTEMYGRNIAEAVVIIYGGSVEPVNAPDLIKNGNVSGFLVGRASLSAKEFGNIIDAVEAV